MFTATIYCQNHAKYTCTLCGKEAMMLNAKTVQYSPTPTCAILCSTRFVAVYREQR